MKTFTFTESTTPKKTTKRSFSRTARIMITCLFAASFALSDTLNSSVQYSIELERKQNSLNTIQEDTRSIENAFRKKMGSIGIPGKDIASLIPASPRPTFQVPLAPFGTLTPQGNTGVVDRGLIRDTKEKRKVE